MNRAHLDEQQMNMQEAINNFQNEGEPTDMNSDIDYAPTVPNGMHE
jgi:hypothetical protein